MLLRHKKDLWNVFNIGEIIMKKKLLIIFCFITGLNGAEQINKKENPLLADLFDAKYAGLTIYYDNMPLEENAGLKVLEDLRKNEISNIIDYLVMNGNIYRICREKICLLQPLEALKSIRQVSFNYNDLQRGLIFYCTAFNDEACLDECIRKVEFLRNNEWKVFIKTHTPEFAQLLIQYFPQASKCINLRYKSEGSSSTFYSFILQFLGLER